MRKLVFARAKVLRDCYWFGVVFVTCCVFQSALCSDLSSHNGSDIVGNATTTGRGSRQLWSLVKNVIKTGLEGSGGGGNAGGGSNVGSGGVGQGLGALASLFGSAIANGINSDGVGGGGGGQYYQNQGQQQQQSYYGQNPSPNQFGNPNDYMHYLLMNSQSNQHASLPHYLQQQQKEQESTADLIEKYKEEMASGTTNVETASSTGNQLLSKLAFGSIFDDLDKVSNLLSFGRIENMVDKVNKFDKLKCIPRLLCQMVSKRREDEKKEEEKQKAKGREDSSTTTRKPTNRKADDDDDDGEKTVKGKEGDGDDTKSRKEESEEDDKQTKKESEEDDEEEEDDDDDDDDSEEVREYVVIKKGADDEDKKVEVKRKGKRQGRFLKLNGSDTALEQFVRFLDLMQLKDWSLYPYLNGAYQGHQVSRTEECAYKFSSCPFSDEQLVYYFNNYNGGFFQSI